MVGDGVQVVGGDDEVVGDDDDEVLENGVMDGILVKEDDTGMLQNLSEAVVDAASDWGPMSCKAVVG